MTTALATAGLFQDLSEICATVAGVKVVIGVNVGDTTSPLVRPLSDDPPTDLTIYLVPGAWSNIAGGAPRVTYGALGSIFMPRQQRSLGGDEVALMNAFDALIGAFAEHGRADSADATVQMVVITEGPGLQEAEWPVDSGNWSLVWPFQLEIKVNPNNLRYKP